MKVCKAHVKKPATIYGQCIGCEIDGLRKRIAELEDTLRKLTAAADATVATIHEQLTAPAPSDTVDAIARFVAEEWDQPDIARGIRLQFAAPSERKPTAQEIALEVHNTCKRIPGANFYTAAEMALDRAAQRAAPAEDDVTSLTKTELLRNIKMLRDEVDAMEAQRAAPAPSEPEIAELCTMLRDTARTLTINDAVRYAIANVLEQRAAPASAPAPIGMLALQAAPAPSEPVGELVAIDDDCGTIMATWTDARWKLPAGTLLYAAAPAPSERQPVQSADQLRFDEDF